MACRTVGEGLGKTSKRTNASLPDLKNLLRIAKALSVDVARLLNIEVVIDDGV